MYDLAERICVGKINKAFCVDNYLAWIHFLNGIFHLKLNYKIWEGSRWAASVIRYMQWGLLLLMKTGFRKGLLCKKKGRFIRGYCSFVFKVIS